MFVAQARGRSTIRSAMRKVRGATEETSRPTAAVMAAMVAETTARARCAPGLHRLGHMIYLLSKALLIQRTAPLLEHEECLGKS